MNTMLTVCFIAAGFTFLVSVVALLIIAKCSETNVYNKPHEYSVFIRDEYYDYITDNDDLEDIPTIVHVIYNSNGKILSVDFADTTSDLCDCESPALELQHFYDTCKINPHGGLNEFKKYTIYREYYKVYGKH